MEQSAGHLLPVACVEDWVLQATVGNPTDRSCWGAQLCAWLPCLWVFVRAQMYACSFFLR